MICYICDHFGSSSGFFEIIFYSMADILLHTKKEPPGSDSSDIITFYIQNV